MRHVNGWLTFLVVLAVAAPALAQRPAVEPARRAASADEQLAAVMYYCCRNEVEIAKFAESRLKSEDCKEFAKMIQEHHQAACDRLQKLAGITDRSSAEARPTDRPAATATAAAAPRALDWVRVHQELADECLKTTKEELGKKEGSDFDRCFMGQQLMAHLKAVDELKVFDKYASESLRGQIKTCQEKAETHLKQARAIVEKQEKGNRATTKTE